MLSEDKDLSLSLMPSGIWLEKKTRRNRSASSDDGDDPYKELNEVVKDLQRSCNLPPKRAAKSWGGRGTDIVFAAKLCKLPILLFRDSHTVHTRYSGSGGMDFTNIEPWRVVSFICCLSHYYSLSFPLCLCLRLVSLSHTLPLSILICYPAHTLLIDCNRWPK